MLDARPQDATAAVTQLAIAVEKKLCGLLGREWSAKGISIDTLCNDLSRALQAVGPEPAVAVKPLTWNERGYAHTGNGTLYWVTRQTDCWLLEKITGSSTFKSAHPSEKAAKAAAEADYASRIRSALGAAPPAGGDDWTVDDTLTAREILDYLGIGSDASLEPYADRRRDAVAKIIQKRIATTPPAEPVVDAHPVYDELVRSRSKELHQKLGRDAMLRQNDPVQTIYDFAWSIWHDGFGEGMNEAEIASKPAVKDDETVVEALALALELIERSSFQWTGVGPHPQVVVEKLRALAAKDGRS